MCTNLKFCAGRLIPCGKCEECLKVKRVTEYNRIRYEYDDSDVAYHITLTYAKLKDFDGFADIREFMKNIRKHVAECSYYAVYEEGELHGRPHFHILVFLKKDACLTEDIVGSCWRFGFIRCRIIKKLCEVRYLTDYLFKHYGKKNIRNFSTSNNFGYQAFLKKYFDHQMLLYISGEDVCINFIRKVFDKNYYKYIVNRLYYGTWKYLPRCWKEKYYRLINSFLDCVDSEAFDLFCQKSMSGFLRKQEIVVRYFDDYIGCRSANGFAYYESRGYSRSPNLDETYRLAGIYYNIFVPHYGLRNMEGPLLEFFKKFCTEHSKYFLLNIDKAPKEWCEGSRRMKYLRENRFDFLKYGPCKIKYFGVDGVFAIEADYLNNVVFL